MQLGAPPPFLTGAGVTNTASAPATASVALRNALGLKAALESGVEAPRQKRAFRRLKGGCVEDVVDLICSNSFLDHAATFVYFPPQASAGARRSSHE